MKDQWTGKKEPLLPLAVGISSSWWSAHWSDLCDHLSPHRPWRASSSSARPHLASSAWMGWGTSSPPWSGAQQWRSGGWCLQYRSHHGSQEPALVTQCTLDSEWKPCSINPKSWTINPKPWGRSAMKNQWGNISNDRISPGNNMMDRLTLCLSVRSFLKSLL